jgi:hypothetical protein
MARIVHALRPMGHDPGGLIGCNMRSSILWVRVAFLAFPAGRSSALSLQQERSTEAP